MTFFVPRLTIFEITNLFLYDVAAVKNETPLLCRYIRKMATRSYTIRRAKRTPDPAWLDYPYAFIGDRLTDYQVDDFHRSIPLDAEPADAGPFPGNIVRYYWIYEGHNDEHPWYALGQLKSGAYFFYVAECDYTGFDCQGGMKLWVSKSFQNLIDHAMTDSEYQEYLNDTVELD
jgi:hypothetical protein